MTGLGVYKTNRSEALPVSTEAASFIFDASYSSTLGAF